MSSEEVVQQLLDFVSETGRLPKSDEPGLEELITAAVKAFGSLENALRVAGLLTGGHGVALPGKPRQSSIVHAPKLKRSVSTYPQDYFLDLLNLKRTQLHGSPALDGTPTWWERRAKTQYICSACRKTIEKGERYIGRRKLHPGMRGIYGYRGTYSTDYYHIICLLRSAKTQIEESIENCGSEIDGIQREISEYRKEASSKKDRIETCRDTMQQAKEDYEHAHGLWRRVGKWFGSSYTSWSRNREISRLREEIGCIENREIPDRQNKIANLTARINNVKNRLSKIEGRMQELGSP